MSIIISVNINSIMISITLQHDLFNDFQYHKYCDVQSVIPLHQISLLND